MSQMHEHERFARQRYYKRIVELLNRTLVVPENLCFVFVQHAFLPSIDFYNSIESRVAAIITKDFLNKERSFAGIKSNGCC